MVTWLLWIWSMVKRFGLVGAWWRWCEIRGRMELVVAVRCMDVRECLPRTVLPGRGFVVAKPAEFHAVCEALKCSLVEACAPDLTRLLWLLVRLRYPSARNDPALLVVLRTLDGLTLPGSRYVLNWSARRDIRRLLSEPAVVAYLADRATWREQVEETAHAG